MKSNIFKFNLDMKKNYKETGITVVQLDNKATIFTVNLKNGELDYNLDTGDTVEVAFLKPDETFVLMDAVASENSVNIELTSQILAVAGKAYCEIRIKKDDKILTSTQFDFFIRENIINNKRIESTTEYKALDKLITKANDVIIQLEHATNALTNVDALTAELEQIKQQIITAKEDIATSINNANTKKTELDAEITKATTALNNLNNALQNWESKKSEITELNNLVTTATELKTALTNLNTSITESKNIKTSLDTSVGNATTAKTHLDSSTSTANTAKTNLDASITSANNAKTSLAEKEAEAKITEQSLLEIIASGDLGQYVTDPKLATELEKYALKTSIKTKLSELTQDSNNRTVTDAEKTKWNNPPTGIPSGGSAGQVLKKTADGVAWGTDNDTKYTHPTSHPASMITETTAKRFVSDVEKTAWDNKQDALGFIPESSSNKGKVNGYAPLDSNAKIPLANLPEIKSLPSGGDTGQVLAKTADGVAWVDDRDTTYALATTSANGLMSSTDKSKLNTGNSLVPSGGSTNQILGWQSNGIAKWIDSGSDNVVSVMDSSNRIKFYKINNNLVLFEMVEPITPLPQRYIAFDIPVGFGCNGRGIGVYHEYRSNATSGFNTMDTGEKSYTNNLYQIWVVGNRFALMQSIYADSSIYGFYFCINGVI